MSNHFCSLLLIFSTTAFGQLAERVLIPVPVGQPKSKVAARSATAQPKVGERVRTAAQRNASVRLRLVLSEQPLRDVYQVVERANEFALGNAEAVTRAAAVSASAGPERRERYTPKIASLRP